MIRIDKIRKLYIWSVVLAFLGVTSCQSSPIDPEDSYPVNAMLFEFSIPNGEPQLESRSKTLFSAGDRVYVTAEVIKTDQTTTKISSILEYQGTWKTLSGEEILAWPEEAESAIFTAYFLPKIYDNSTPEIGQVINLCDLRNASDDPLIAERTNIKVNGLVRLQFKHMVSKLYFTGLNLKTTNVKLMNTNSSFAMSNQVVVRYDPLEGYSHEFLSDGTNEIIMPTTGTSTQEACLFLYVDKADWTTYQSDFRVDQLDQSDAQISSTSLATVALYNMVRGRAYRIYFLSNTVVSDLAEEEKWEMYKDDPVRKFETEEEISTYFAGLTTGKLEEDLDFNDILLSNEVITLSANFTRGVNLSKSFDGNYHTIKNIHVKNGLFNSIPSGCTVQNLKLENVRVFADENSTHAGILAPISQGTISNVRIVGANMIGTNGSGYVGGLVGMNKGNISNVMISGVLTIDSYNDISNAGSLFCIGGLVGANGDAKSGNYSITNCTVDAGALIKVAGEIPDTEAYIGGLVGYNAIAKTVSGSSTSVSIDAIDLHSKNCYVGGFVGYNRGIVRLGNATGNITGGSVSSSLSGSGLLSATGGFVGYATSGTETASANFAVMNGCSASGIVRESDNGILPSYTGGLAGFAEIDILNGSSTGTLEIASGVNPEKRMGALIGILAAASTIHNSYSMSIRSDGITMLITGAVSCQTDNCHYLGKMLRADNGCEHDTPIPARAITLNNGRKTGYWEWVESSAIHGGAPYLVKQ